MQERIIVFFLSLFLVAGCSSTGNRAPSSSSSGPMEYALDKLRQRNASEDFLQMLETQYREDERLKVLDLNLLGFLRDRPEQEESIPYWELRKVDTFVRKYRKTFRREEARYPVPKEVIASLLWVETKYGRDIGTFHVASSFLTLAMADFPTIIDQTIDLARERAKDLPAETERKIIERSQAKSAWAVEELLALEEIHEKGYKDASTLEGSFSGAFGMAQFLPSSYLSWAKGLRHQPNLFRAEDSIFSVANYLKMNGWKRKDLDAQRAALFHYNRDANYVNRILRMSDCLKAPAKRKRWNSRRRTAAVGSC
jgi:membrane-bound lytic murein transglycosylase B